MTATGISHQAPPVQWALARVPASWRICRVKDVAILNRESLPETTDPDFTFNYIDISAVDSIGGIGDGEFLSFGSAPSRARRCVRPGDSIVSTVRTYLKSIGYIDNRGPELVASTGFATLSPRPGMHPRFLYWWLRSGPFVEDVVARSVGVSYPAVNASDVGDVAVPVPPVDEQRRIADFLDAETSRIDDLLLELDALRSLTSARSSAAQSQLVVAGVHGRPLRDSGLQWLGSIADGWSIVPLKSVARMESGHTPSRSRPELWEQCTIPWISLNDVGTMGRTEWIADTANLISEAGIAASSARLLPQGTVVLSRDATIGRAAIMALPMATSQHFAAWVCGARLRPRYLWLLLSTVMQPLFETLTEGSTIRTIGMPELRSFKIPLPPVDEQDAIADRAALARQQAHGVEVEVDVQLRLLREHRQALITAAVTGGLNAVRKVT